MDSVPMISIRWLSIIVIKAKKQTEAIRREQPPDCLINQLFTYSTKMNNHN